MISFTPRSIYPWDTDLVKDYVRVLNVSLCLIKAPGMKKYGGVEG
jgi:hypothetical protein